MSSSPIDQRKTIATKTLAESDTELGGKLVEFAFEQLGVTRALLSCCHFLETLLGRVSGDAGGREGV